MQIQQLHCLFNYAIIKNLPPLISQSLKLLFPWKTDPAVDFDLEAILDCQQIPDALTLGEMNEEVVEDELQPQDSPQKVWRDTIAWEMWVQYVQALVERQIQQQN
jgi:hypothetical protein